MRIVMLFLAGVISCGLFMGHAVCEPPKEEPAKSKPNPDRLKGMKTALIDIEAGTLKMKYPPFPDTPQRRAYTDSLKKECGVQAETIQENQGKAGLEMAGYNDVMRVEIESRFGKGILENLWGKAYAKKK